MDKLQTEPRDLEYIGLPPILLAASSEAAKARAERSVQATGRRVAARLSIENAEERLTQQGALSALWVEIDRDCGGPMDELMRRVSADVSDGRYAAVISTTPELVDPLAAKLDANAVELIVDASDAERVSALAIATARHQARLGLSDIANDSNAERLRHLSEEVSRIASTLARLSTTPGLPPQRPEIASAENVPELSADAVRSVIRARRLRSRYFADELFADPAWDMLLDLLQAEITQLRVPVSSLCIAAAVPATTALRWLKTMVSEGIFVRRADPHDGRRVFVELAPETSNALRRYFAEVGQVAVI